MHVFKYWLWTCYMVLTALNSVGGNVLKYLSIVIHCIEFFLLFISVIYWDKKRKFLWDFLKADIWLSAVLVSHSAAHQRLMSYFFLIIFYLYVKGACFKAYAH